MTDLQKTPLHAMHLAAGARMAPFAGYDMPIGYPEGSVAEHRQARERAALFDVSHMGQVRLVGPEADAALERLVPGDMRGLGPGRMRYTLFTSDEGGILDDLIAARAPDGLALVVNAARKQHDIAHLRRHLADAVEVRPEPDRALLALQGPAAASVLAEFADLPFMAWREGEALGVPVRATRSGYTGSDGFELSVAAEDAEALAGRLLAHEAVAWAGLGARDSLRLEAGLCLYGHDIDETTTPLEAGLGWTIPKVRRERRDFPGAARILGAPPERRRVGLRPEGRVIAREGAALLDEDGRAVGKVTSGGFSPILGGPVAMGYLPAALARPETPVAFEVRGRPRPGRVARLPFVPHDYYRGSEVR